jgi:hypothetical protein
MLIKMKAGKYKLPVNLTAKKGRFYFQFPFNRELMAEIKGMRSPRWHGYDDPPLKQWSVKDCRRNRFQIAYLTGQNPYDRYDSPLLEAMPRRDNLYSHQRIMFRHIITRMQCLISGEMGVGKTLSALEAMEYVGYNNYIWVGTGSSLAAVKLEFRKWKSELRPVFITYHSFSNAVNNNEIHIPEGIIFDECQKLKSHNTQRSLAADKLTEEMRLKYKEPLIICMSGAPAPNNPTDWWHQCEVACPGYIKEGDWFKFRNRLAITSEHKSPSDQTYLKVEAWLDSDNKCRECGKPRKDHDPFTGHPFQKCTNEVKNLYKRMNGLNVVFFKKDCLDLPPIQYKVFKLTPTDLILKAEQLILNTVPRTVTALMKLRELSDGFQYKETETGKSEPCPLCKGSGETSEYYDPEYPEEYPSQEAMETGRCKQRTVKCTHCKGEKRVPQLQRQAQEISCPKDDLLLNLLEEHEDVGRLVTYAGFQASVDRCCRLSADKGWEIIRADGRGWDYYKISKSRDEPDRLNIPKEGMLELFQDTKTHPNKLIFIGQPGAAGTGLTLTASPSIFFWSNSFNADDRIQAISRGHRIGMGDHFTVIDCVHLDTDQKILDALEKKLDLLKMSMGQLREASIEKRELIEVK